MAAATGAHGAKRPQGGMVNAGNYMATGAAVGICSPGGTGDVVDARGK